MSSIHYEEMSKLAEKLIDNAALVEILLSKVGNQTPQLPSRRSTRYERPPFSHVKQDPSGIYNSPDLYYVSTCNNVCNTNHNVCHDASPNFYGAEDMYSKSQQNIEQVESPYMLPNNPSFTPSMNSRAGWKFDKCYDVQREVGTALYHCFPQHCPFSLHGLMRFLPFFERSCLQ